MSQKSWSVRPNVPNYQGGSIVNLVAGISSACGGTETGYSAADLMPVSELKRARNIVLLVLDGLGYDYVCRHGANTSLGTHLRGSLTSVFPTTTASAITSLATGVAAQQHAVTGWFMFLKEVGVVTAIMPFKPRYGGKSYTASGVSMRSVVSVKSVFEQMTRAGYLVSRNDLVQSEYSLTVAEGAQRRSYTSLEGCFSSIARTVQEGDEAKFVHAYWPDFDGLCHEFGVASAEALAHFHALDAQFTLLLETLRNTDTWVLVTADHGLIDTSSNTLVHLDKHPALRATLALPLCGEPRAAYCYVRPSRAAQFERYVAEEMSAYCELARAEELVEAGWFGLGRPNPKLFDRIGDYVLLMKENYAIKDHVLGEDVYKQVGVHGGLSRQELFVPLIAAHV